MDLVRGATFSLVLLAACGGGSAGTVPVSECSTGLKWTGGDEESPLMHPGMACISCHSMRQAPSLEIAGTVYGALHDGDDCYGSPGVSVVITGADGRVTTLTTNESGNFSLRSRGTIALPFRAKIVSGSQERVMATPQMSGDCSSCHSAAGAEGAAGRITL